MLTRLIPSSGESLPVIGVGTYKGFDVGSAGKDRAALSEVLRALFSANGSVVDSSPMYGRAEGVVGDLLAALSALQKTFVATKVWTEGPANRPVTWFSESAGITACVVPNELRALSVLASTPPRSKRATAL